MDEDRFNMAIRKFLKEVGVTSQREIERVVRESAIQKQSLRLRMTLTSEDASVVSACRRNDDRVALTSIPMSSSRSGDPYAVTDMMREAMIAFATTSEVWVPLREDDALNWQRRAHSRAASGGLTTAPSAASRSQYALRM